MLAIDAAGHRPRAAAIQRRKLQPAVVLIVVSFTDRPEHVRQRGLHPDVEAKTPLLLLPGELLHHRGTDIASHPATHSRVDGPAPTRAKPEARQRVVGGAELGAIVVEPRGEVITS